MKPQDAVRNSTTLLLGASLFCVVFMLWVLLDLIFATGTVSIGFGIAIIAVFAVASVTSSFVAGRVSKKAELPRRQAFSRAITMVAVGLFFLSVVASMVLSTLR